MREKDSQTIGKENERERGKKEKEKKKSVGQCSLESTILSQRGGQKEEEKNNREKKV